MNLWHIFHESILDIDGILRLPYFAIVGYVYVCYAMIKHTGQRKYLLMFTLLSFVASFIMLKNLGPRGGEIIPPLLLLLVAAMPTVMLLSKLNQKIYHEAGIWFVVTLVGWLHSLSWGVWLFALARS